MNRINRGGSWNLDPQMARVAFRDCDTPDCRRFLGLRLARDES